jgi:WG containing repeat
MQKQSSLFFICLAVLTSISYGQQGIAGEPSSLFPVKQNGKWGYIDKTGHVVVEPQFSFAAPFSGEYSQIYIDDHWGYIDRTGYHQASVRSGLGVFRRAGP